MVKSATIRRGRRNRIAFTIQAGEKQKQALLGESKDQLRAQVWRQR